MYRDKVLIERRLKIWDENKHRLQVYYYHYHKGAWIYCNDVFVDSTNPHEIIKAIRDNSEGNRTLGFDNSYWYHYVVTVHEPYTMDGTSVPIEHPEFVNKDTFVPSYYRTFPSSYRPIP